MKKEREVEIPRGSVLFHREGEGERTESLIMISGT